MADHKQGDDNDVIVKLALATGLYVIKHLTFEEEGPSNVGIQILFSEPII